MHTFTRVASILATAALPLLAQAAVVADPEPPQAVSAVTAHASANGHFGTAELDRLLAPVALYPDSVLTQVLAASTYPLEIVEAARWSREHSSLRGQEAVDAVGHMDWDPSVKALVAFPELLARMDADLQWTQDLGDAFLAQQGEVMDRVQYLRDRAEESGHLSNVEHVRVVHEHEYIYIEPEAADVLWVPYYDPWVVYGPWWWPAYPPYYWAYWGGHPRAYYASYGGGFYWGIGFRVAPSFYFCAFNWPHREVVVVNHYDVHNNYYYGHSPQRFEGSSRWEHSPEHRHGVAYRTPEQNEQWHHGYGRPAPSQPAGPGHAERGERGERPEHREWTVNRAEHPERVEREERADRPQRMDSPRPDRPERVDRPERQRRSEPREDRPQREQRATPREDRPREDGRVQREDRASQREDRQAQRAERAPQREERPQEERQAPQGDERPRARQRREPQPHEGNGNKGNAP